MPIVQLQMLNKMLFSKSDDFVPDPTHSQLVSPETDVQPPELSTINPTLHIEEVGLG